jgi:ADP-heptose:LPS heptosyltransferase
MIRALGPGSNEPPEALVLNVLFVTSTRIGDAVLSTGLLDYVLTRHPGARLTIACGPVAAPLFEAVPGRVETIVMTKRPRAGHWVDLWSRCVLRPWRLVVDLRGSTLGFMLAAWERRVLGGGRRVGGHRVERLARLFDLDPPPAPRVWLSAQHEAAAAEFAPPGGPILALGPTANWRGKQWRAERFAELASRLTAPGGPLADARVMVLGGPGERESARAVLSCVPPGRLIDLVDRCDLPTAAACLRRARLYVGNDSGLMHLAAAAGTPTLGLFGPSPVEHYRPWGPLTAVAATRIPYAELVGAPDFDHRTTDTLMDSLEVDRVEETARGLLARASAAGRD